MQEDNQLKTEHGDRVWNVRTYRSISPELKVKIDQFFGNYYPTVFRSNEAGLSLQWKIGQENPFGQGFLDVALLPSGEVVGIASAAIRPVVIAGQTILGIEVGDTFTAPKFRKTGESRESFDPNKLKGTEFETNYLNKSVFGRLMYEILVQAQENGFRVAYGTPNNLSLRPYQKRFKFEKIAEKDLYSLYILGSHHGNLLKKISAAQQVYLILKYKAQKKSIENVKEMKPTEWIQGYLRENSNSTTNYSFPFKNTTFLQYRYLKHPYNRYTFYQYTNKKNKKTYFILRKKSSTELQIVDISKNTTTRDLLKIILFVNNIKEPGQKILIWRLLSKLEAFTLATHGVAIRRNITLIVKYLSGSTPKLTINDLSIGDSDNG